MNICILSGNLARDPEKSYTQSGMAVTRFTLAVRRSKTGADGVDADFIRVTVWDKQAENAEKYLRKGSKVAVEGRVQTSSYERDGQKIYSTDIIGSRVEFLDSKKDPGDSQDRDRKEAAKPEQRPAQSFDDLADNDMPF